MEDLMSNSDWSEFREKFLKVLLYAYSGAFEIALGSIEAGVVFSEDFVNEAVVLWTNIFLPDLLDELEETTRVGISESIAGWYGTGQSIDDLINTIADKVLDYDRAIEIAKTEVTRGYGAGNLWYWSELGIVEGKKWYTNQDEMVCPICRDLHGEARKLDEEFSIGVQAPPAHARCRCQMLPIVSMGE